MSKPLMHETTSEYMAQMDKQYHARRAPAAFLTPLNLCVLSLALAWGLKASAQTTTTTTNFAVAKAIPDANASGLASAKIVSTPIAYVTDVNVMLKITGTYNGDLYCY